ALGKSGRTPKSTAHRGAVSFEPLQGDSSLAIPPFHRPVSSSAPNRAGVDRAIQLSPGESLHGILPRKHERTKARKERGNGMNGRPRRSAVSFPAGSRFRSEGSRLRDISRKTLSENWIALGRG